MCVCDMYECVWYMYECVCGVCQCMCVDASLYDMAVCT